MINTQLHKKNAEITTVAPYRVPPYLVAYPGTDCTRYQGTSIVYQVPLLYVVSAFLWNKTTWN